MPRPTPSMQHPECVVLEDGRCLELLDVIGKGGGSLVYRALLESSSGMRRLVALKFFAAVASDEAEHVFAMLARTAQRTACVRHPNVVDVLECGTYGGRPFFVSELVEGVSLATFAEHFVRQRRRFPLDVALFVASEAAEALSAARTAPGLDGVQLGLLHLGLSAREVLLSFRGEVKVEGFEMATARAATSSVRSLRALAGRANTMAPEIAQGAEGDARCDVFSLGVLMRELFVGPRFPPGLTNAEAIRLAREGYVHPVSFQPNLPERLVEVMQRALEVEPENRYPNASAMAFDLRRVALSLGVGDGRYFLRRALARELHDGADEITKEILPGIGGPADIEEIYAVHDAELFED